MNDWDEDRGSAPPEGRQPQAGPALGELGALMLDAGYAVTDVGHVLTAVARSHGREDIVAGAFPAAVMVDDHSGTGARLHPSTGQPLTFDQVGETGRLVARASRGRVEWVALREGIERVRQRPVLWPTWAVILGSGLMSTGIAVVFGVGWWALLADGLLGVAMGVALLTVSRFVRVAAVLPFFSAFAVTVALWSLAAALGAGHVPLFAVCAPLVVLIPGATVTNAVIELSAGDVVSGGGRFISGLVMWGLLAAGIAAGTQVVGAHVEGSAIVGQAGRTTHQLGMWGGPVSEALTWPAIGLVGLGVGLFFSCSVRLTGVIVATLWLAYAVTLAAQPSLGIGPATGVAAGVTLAATRVVEVLRPRYPSVVVFRPAYWLLVPGSFGLVAVAADGDAHTDFLSTTVATVIALTIGTQVGAIVVEAAESIVRRRRRHRAAVVTPPAP